MLFYMCSIPKSVLEIDTVENVVMERYDCYTSKAVEYDISTDSDVLGHFIMCLIASKSPLLYEIILRGETILFVDKLNKMNRNDIFEELHCAVRFLNSLDQIEDSSSVNSKLQQKRNLVKNILKVIRYKGNHVLHGNHRKTCYKYEMMVPFTFPLKLVAEREINIVEGKAKVPCGLWIELLIGVFELFLQFEIEFLKGFYLLQHMIYKSEDDRLRNVIEKVEKNMTGVIPLVNEAMSADDIDEDLQYYPPCMSNLHKILRQTHRLSYYSRYQYTLFLKDIGLPAKENVAFWKNEYTKPYNGSSCTHKWEENVARYEYQILHLYGLIGTTTLKTSHSCDKFIEKLTLRMDGGCPFVHFTDEDLRKSFLKDMGDIEDLMQAREGGRPQRACALYFLRKNSLLQNNGKKMITEMSSPLNYYNLAKGSALLSCRKM